MVVSNNSEVSVKSASTRSGSFKGKGQSKGPNSTSSRYVLFVRIGFILFLLASAAVLGWAAHYFLKEAENDIGVTRFASSSDRALETAREKASRQVSAARTNTAVIGNVYPDVEQYPFVAVSGFDDILANVQATAGGRDGGWAPLVKPEEVPEFEVFAYEYIEKYFPPGFGVSEFGKGIFAFDFSLNNTDKRFHDISGNNTCGSPYKFLNPTLHYSSFGSDGFRDVLMINVYSVCYAARAIDAMLDHSQLRFQAHLNDEPVPEPAGFWQGFSYPPFDYPATLGPATTYNSPVYPRNNPFNLTGFSGVQIRWIDVLSGLFEQDINGIYCVIERSVDGVYVDAFTFEIVNGEPSFVGQGNLPAIEWKENSRIGLVDPDNLLPGASDYTLVLYSTDEFYETYETNNPKVATFGALAIMSFTVLVFLLYDKLQRKEVRHKESVLDAQRQFMRFVSHEVRTPLNTVCMGLKLLQEEVDSLVGNVTGLSETSVLQAGTKMIHTLAQEIASMADDAVSILDDLLNFDKIQHGELNLELKVLPIWSVIEATFNEFKMPAKAKDIDLCLELSGDMEDESVYVDNAAAVPTSLLDLKSVGDRIRLAQVLRNCLSNALKFTPEKGSVCVRARFVPGDSQRKETEVELDIENCAQKVSFLRKGNLVVDVVDTGPGMTKEQLGKLFGLGVQFNVNELQAGKGSGLGLHIARGLVERHGGSLSAASEGLGMGSTFTMTIPLYYVPDSMLPPIMNRQRAGAQAGGSPMESESKTVTSDTGELTVLVVDDAAMNRKMLVRLLENRGYICHQAADGEQAVAVYKQLVESGVCVDSILMDFEMPVMNGPDACRVLRDMKCTSFIAGVTGNVLHDDVEYFKNSGADAVLAKPLKVNMLEGLWREYLVIP